jgi:fumarylacetoacetate (FAA) hydrolase family protein
MNISGALPDDGVSGTLIGRAWLPGAGPAIVAIRADGVFDITVLGPTVSAFLDADAPVAEVRATVGRHVGGLDEILENSVAGTRVSSAPHFLAPIDLQVIKAGGVNFLASLMERVIEERARGDAALADEIRAELGDRIGGDLSGVRPGSAEAARLKEALIEQGLWSQYLEVGIGPDAEIFTKVPVLSAVGTGGDVGVHPASSWNNPEPEAVLAINSRGRTVGAMLGNDVNLRDVEGRSALLLGRAKDNNGSCALGPFLRLFDETFSLDDVWQAEIALTVEGEDNYRLEGTSSMTEISRTPDEFLAQLIGPNHHYPDGLVFFTGTMFAPIEDRDMPGQGFTHKPGDVVTISSAKLGTLINRVDHCDKIAAWEFGIGALMRNLAVRGLL